MHCWSRPLAAAGTQQTYLPLRKSLTLSGRGSSKASPYRLFLPLARNEPRRALQGHIGPGPLKENDESVPEADQKKDVDEDPDHPSHKAGKFKPVEIRYRRSPSNGGQGAHIQIMKRLGS